MFVNNFQLSQMEILYEYFASGIADSGIRQFGGDDCYNEIPALYHWSVSIFFGFLAIYLAWFWRSSLADINIKVNKMNPNLTENICFWVGLISLLMTLYFKIITKRGLFILNPCHIALVMMLILLRAEDNSSLSMRRFHTAWTAWLLGPFGALAFPHLEEISWLEFFLYFVQHLVILPIGPLILHRRYGNMLPTFKNQIASYSTILAFQTLPLVIISRALKVNLNFTLCHSPAEPYFDDYGYHYFTIEIFNVCLIAYAVRLTTYLYVEGFYWVTGKIIGKAKQIKNE